MENILFELNEPSAPIIGIINGKWCLYGDPINKLSQNDKQIVFNHIADKKRIHEELTDNLKF